MSRESNPFFGLVAAAGVLGLIWSHDFNSHPPSEGADFLNKNGYADVKEISSSFGSNVCGDNILGRRYRVKETSTGQQTEKTVCFGAMGPFIPNPHG